MPTCMHNMSMFMNNMPVFMHNMPVFMHNMPVFMHNMPMFMHNCQCSCTTCQCSCTTCQCSCTTCQCSCITCQCSCTTCQCSCTMSMFMHNMPMFMHNMPMFMHNMPSCKHNILTAWTKCQHDICTHNMPTRTVIYQHAICSATCPYAGTICMREVHAHYSHLAQPKDQSHDEPTRGFPSISRSWKRLLKLLRSQARLETNIRDRWQNHSQPAKGPGVRCIRYQGGWQFSRTVCRNRLGKVMLVAVNFCRPGATVPI